MKTLKEAAVKTLLTDNHAMVNSYVQLLMAKQNGLYGFQIEDEDIFFNLLFHYHRHSQIITPPNSFGRGKEYPIRAVAQYMIDNNYTFEKLANNDIPGKYTPSWFGQCMPIFKNFSYDKMSPILVKAPTSNEIKENPNTVFRIADGAHRCLVLAYKLLKKEIEFRPLDAIFLIVPPKY